MTDIYPSPLKPRGSWLPNHRVSLFGTHQTAVSYTQFSINKRINQDTHDKSVNLVGRGWEIQEGLAVES